MTRHLATRSRTASSCAVLLLALAACGGDGGEAGEPADGEEAADLQRMEAGGASLELPRSVPAGSPFEVTWTGPDASNDYLSVAREGSEDGDYVDYTYTREGSPLNLRAPDRPGAHEVRYVLGEGDSVLVRAPLAVDSVDATLEAPGEVGAGSPFEVTWTGPDNPSDYLSLAEPGSEDGDYVDYTYTREGSPLNLRAPDTPGTHEVRYVMGQSDRVLARRPVEVTSVEASLEVRDTLMVDTPVEVTWSGPGNPSDYVAFAEQGTSGGEQVSYTYTREGSPLSIRTPEHPGRYELRYVMAQSDRVLASRTVTVLPLQARLQAPDSVAAGREIEVAWLGPDGPDDFVALAAPDAAPGQYESRALTRAGDPAALFAPGAAGTYELRYVWAERDTVLARRPVVVTGS